MARLLAHFVFAVGVLISSINKKRFMVLCAKANNKPVLNLRLDHALVASG